MVLIDESTRDGLLCWVAATVAPSGSSNGLSFYPGIRGKVTNAMFDLCYRTTGDLTSTLAGIRMQRRLCSDSQLLPLSWNGRCVKSLLDLPLQGPCIKSKSITGTE